MSTTSDAANDLPDYADQFEAFHAAFFAELKAVVASLPFSPTMKVLDVGCGDGFYTRLLAERLMQPGRVIGVDIDPAYLTVAREQMSECEAQCGVDFVAADLAHLPERCRDCDFVWCAQSLYSLPEPVAALRHMAAAAKPGGIVAVLENDSLHQLLLPWPIHLEIAMRAAELLAFCHESLRPSKYYVGRKLPTLFAEAGLEPLGFQTQCIDRQSPLSRDLEAFVQSYLDRMYERVGPRIDPQFADEFRELIDRASDKHLLRQPWFTMSWLNVLAWGRRPI